MPPDRDELGMDQASVDRIRDVMSRVEATDSDLVDPPPDLWEGIEAAVDSAFERAPSRPASAPTRKAAQIVVLADHRRRRRALAAAAAIIVAAAIVGGVVASRGGSSPTGTLVASASLRPLEGHATARAKLIRSDGHLRLELTTHQMPAPPTGQYYELWLMDRSITVPVSLGSMTGSTTVTIPPGVDTARFPVVDISLQPDGHPGYSGHSVLRGTLA